MPKRSSKPRCSEQSPGCCCASLGNPPPSFPEHPPSTLGGSITLFALLSSSCRVSQPSTEEQEDGGTLNPYTASETLQALAGGGKHPHLPWRDGSSTPMQITGHSPPRCLRAARLTQSKLHQLLGPPTSYPGSPIYCSPLPHQQQTRTKFPGAQAARNRTPRGIYKDPSIIPYWDQTRSCLFPTYLPLPAH